MLRDCDVAPIPLWQAFLELIVDDDDESGSADCVPADAPVNKLLDVFENAFNRPMGPPPQCADAQHRLTDRSSAQGRSKRKVKDVARERGWTLARSKTHLVYKRTVGGRRQTYVASKTPSDRRATRNQLRVLDALETNIDHNLAPPRFKVGARVDCNCDGGWRRGTVVDHHYLEDWMEKSAPYQVRLDHEGGVIFAPEDDDRYIRAVGAGGADGGASRGAAAEEGGGRKANYKGKGGKKGGKRR